MKETNSAWSVTKSLMKSASSTMTSLVRDQVRICAFPTLFEFMEYFFNGTVFELKLTVHFLINRCEHGNAEQFVRDSTSDH